MENMRVLYLGKAYLHISKCKGDWLCSRIICARQDAFNSQIVWLLWGRKALTNWKLPIMVWLSNVFINVQILYIVKYDLKKSHHFSKKLNLYMKLLECASILGSLWLVFSWNFTDLKVGRAMAIWQVSWYIVLMSLYLE